MALRLNLRLSLRLNLRLSLRLERANGPPAVPLSEPPTVPLSGRPNGYDGRSAGARSARPRRRRPTPGPPPRVATGAAARIVRVRVRACGEAQNKIPGSKSDPRRGQRPPSRTIFFPLAAASFSPMSLPRVCSSLSAASAYCASETCVRRPAAG